MKFRKKPVVIDAVQWTGDNLDDVAAFFPEMSYSFLGRRLKVFTLEGEHIARPGDWIIKGVNGEFYPCKPDIFEKTYELEASHQPTIFVRSANDDTATRAQLSDFEAEELERCVEVAAAGEVNAEYRRRMCAAIDRCSPTRALQMWSGDKAKMKANDDMSRSRCVRCDAYVERLEAWRDPTNEERTRYSYPLGQVLKVAKAACRCGPIGLAVDWSIALDVPTPGVAPR